MPRRHPLECVHLNLAKRHPRLPPPLPGADDQVYRPPVEYRLELDKPLLSALGASGTKPQRSAAPSSFVSPAPSSPLPAQLQASDLRGGADFVNTPRLWDGHSLCLGAAECTPLSCPWLAAVITPTAPKQMSSSGREREAILRAPGDSSAKR